MAFDAHVAFVDVLARNRAQILIAGILVKPISDLQPADVVIKFAYLLFGVFGHYSAHVNGSPTKTLNVSSNCAMPSSLNTFSTGHTSRSSQKFIKRQGNGRGYSKKNRYA